MINTTTNPLMAGDLIRVYSGEYLDVLNPDPEKIKIEDIAHSLSLICRFTGHTKKFFSVAEHCIMCCEKATHNKLEALMHDSTEAYLNDISSPTKYRLHCYKEAELNLEKTIAEKFNLQWPWPKEVKDIDMQMLEVEWDNKVLADNFKSMQPEMAEKVFLQYFKTYYNG